MASLNLNDRAAVEARSQHQRPPRPRAPSPRPRSQAITPPAPHTAAPLEPQAQRPDRHHLEHRPRGLRGASPGPSLRRGCRSADSRAARHPDDTMRCYTCREAVPLHVLPQPLRDAGRRHRAAAEQRVERVPCIPSIGTASADSHGHTAIHATNQSAVGPGDMQQEAHRTSICGARLLEVAQTSRTCCRSRSPIVTAMSDLVITITGIAPDNSQHEGGPAHDVYAGVSQDHLGRRPARLRADLPGRVTATQGHGFRSGPGAAVFEVTPRLGAR